MNATRSPQADEFEQKWETHRLESAVSLRHKVSSSRAFRRFFFWWGVPITIIWLSIFDGYTIVQYEIRCSQNVDMPQSERERFRNDLLWANFVFGPFSCLLFGLGPGVMAWGWLQMFPESVIGDEELFGKRDPMPSPLSESLLADDSMSPAAEGANPSEQRTM